MNDLITWLRIQLDDDEAATRVISAGGYDPQTWRAGPDGPGHVGVLLFADDHMIGDPPEAIEQAGEPFAVVIGGRAEHRHIVRWDPARVLAEVEAKRRILDAHGQPHECIELTGSGDRSAVDGQPWALWEPQHTADQGPCLVVRLLAQPYAGRPGWREEWRA